MGFTVSDASSKLRKVSVTQQNIIGNNNDMTVTGTGVGRWDYDDVISCTEDVADPLGRANNANNILFGTSTLVMRQQLITVPSAGEPYTFSCWIKRVIGDGNFRVDYGDGQGSHILRPTTGLWYPYVVPVVHGGSDWLDFNCPNSSVNTGFHIYGCQLNLGNIPFYYLENVGGASYDVQENEVFVNDNNLKTASILV